MRISVYLQTLVLSITLVLLLISCSPLKKYTKQLDNTSEKQNYMVGLMLYDPGQNKVLATLNHERYFTPASNTKIFTLYTALQTLGDSIPAALWKTRNDTLYLKATGDPTLLHPYFKSEAVLKLIKKSKANNVVLDTREFNDEKYGPGWAWEDFAYYFMPERSGLPVYGNVVRITGINDSIKMSPDSFLDHLYKQKSDYPRDIRSNTFYLTKTTNDTLYIPFIISDSISLYLLNKLASKKITAGKFPLSFPTTNTLYSTASNSVYKRMMEVSDNFLAEQLMILSSGKLSDSLSVKKSIDYSLNTLLPDLPQRPRWVDGSGLSRYNLFSPHDFVFVLNKMYREYDRKRLFTLFPKIQFSEKTINNQTVFIYAKTGSFSNNYCLSGYLLTKSGKTLIFSFMANHFTVSSAAIKKEIQWLLNKIRDTY